MFLISSGSCFILENVQAFHRKQFSTQMSTRKEKSTRNLWLALWRAALRGFGLESLVLLSGRWSGPRLRLDASELCLDQLCLVQTLVQRARLHQLIVPPLGDNPAVIHHDNYVGGNDGAEPVGNYKAGSPPHYFFDSPVNFGFAVCIDLAGRLVKNQNRLVFQNRSGYDNSL
jgi:hypothetical protein